MVDSFNLEFDKYDQASKKMYTILIKYCKFIQIGSCDEAYLDIGPITVDWKNKAMDIATQIKKEIFDATNLVVSIGAGTNILMARLSTKKAKPNGIHIIDDIQADFGDLKVDNLPSIGYKITQKLQEFGISTVNDLSTHNIFKLKQQFGSKIGENLYNFARGIDDRVLENKPRQTISAEINYAIRFKTTPDFLKFLNDLSDTVIERLGNRSFMSITVNLKKRLYEGEPSKYLGHGHCQDLSQSLQLSNPTSDVSVLKRHVSSLFKQFNLEVDFIRGVGITVGKLVESSSNNGIKKYFTVERQDSISDISGDNISKKETVDKDFFDAMPLYIQNEISKEYPTSSKSEKVKYKEPKTPTKLDKGKANLSFSPVRFEGYRMSQIDPDVWKLLSFEIQQEIKNDIKQKPPPKNHPDDIPANFIPSFSQIDPSVFNQLPAHIQEEFKIPNKVKAEPTTQSFNTSITNLEDISISQLDESVLAALSPDLRNHIHFTIKNKSIIQKSKVHHQLDLDSKTPPRKPITGKKQLSFRGYTDHTEILKLVFNWVEFNNPNQVDVQYLVDFLLEALKDYSDLVSTILDSMFGKIGKLESKHKDWDHYLKYIKIAVNDKVVEEFEYPLKILKKWI